MFALVCLCWFVGCAYSIHEHKEVSSDTNSFGRIATAHTLYRVTRLKLDTMEVANTGSDLVFLRKNTAKAKHKVTCCGPVNADRSIRPKVWLRGTNEPSEPLEYHAWIIERRFGLASTSTPTNTLQI